MKSVDIKIIFYSYAKRIFPRRALHLGPHFKGAYFLDYFCNFAI